MIGNRDQRVLTARELRVNCTTAEVILWDALRNRLLTGLRFYRQRPIGRFIVDFYCAAAHLVVEVDGDIHDYHADYDLNRTKYLEDRGLLVIRFSNEMVMNDLEGVLSQIKEIAIHRVTELTPRPPPLIPGEGAGDAVVDADDGVLDLTTGLQRDRAAPFARSPAPESRGEETDLTPDPSPDSKGGETDLTPRLPVPESRGGETDLTPRLPVPESRGGETDLTPDTSPDSRGGETDLTPRLPVPESRGGETDLTPRPPALDSRGGGRRRGQ